MRHEITFAFSNFMKSQILTISRVAILGGSSHDPEVRIIESLFPSAEIHFFDIDNPNKDGNFHFLDINTTSEIKKFESFFDLVVSSQVLEHIWNHSNYFALLENLTNTNGLVWVNCPMSNLVHGSPHYYSAGFTSAYLSYNLITRDFTILESGEIGNKRYYLAVHFARYWQSPKENAHPIIGYNFQPGSKLGVIRKFLREFPSRAFLALIPNAKSNNTIWATESYVAARREKD